MLELGKPQLSRGGHVGAAAADPLVIILMRKLKASEAQL
jgi:hypothetical protein